MIVKIKKVERSVNWGAKDPKTGKLKALYDNCKDYIVPGLDKNSGVIRTGLKNPTEEKKFEKLLGMEEGTLKKSSDYWTSYRIEIPDGGLTLRADEENAKDLLAYKVLQADPHIAKSLTELKTHPTAEYVMTTDAAEAKVSNTKRNVKANAYKIFATLSEAETIDALYMFGKDPSTLDFEVAQDRLGEIVDKDPAKFLAILGDGKFKQKVKVIKYIKAGTVRKHGRGTGYDMPLYYQDVLLGTGLDAAVDFLSAKENQDTAIGVEKAYKEDIKR